MNPQSFAVALVLSGPAYAQCDPAVIVPGSPHAYFGTAMALDGDWAAVTSLGAPEIGAGGMTFVYHRLGTAWVLDQTSANFPTSTVRPGTAIHAQGGSVVAAGGAEVTTGPGQVWIGGRNPQGLWLTSLITGNPGDQAGEALATNGTDLLIGAPGANGGLGVVRHYQLGFDFGAGIQQHTLVASLSAPGSQATDDFGGSLALDGDVLVIGAQRANLGSGNAGKAYVARRAGATWVLEATLDSPTPDSGGAFGVDVAVQGDTVVVGAPREVGASGNDGGAAHVFERISGAWVHVQRLVSHSAPNNARFFGFSVGLEGDRVFVGAPLATTGSIPGRVDVFRRSGPPGAPWSPNGSLPYLPGDQYAIDLAIDGTRLLVGASTAPPYGQVLHYEHVDCDADGAIDGCQIAADPALDCDVDGVIDACAIAAGTATDCNLDGVPDACQCGPLHFEAQPQSVDVGPGQPVVLAVEACGPPPLVFQWRKDGVALSDGGGISGTDTSTLSIAAVTHFDAGSYTCDVSNPCDALTSFPAIVEVATGAGFCGTDGWYDSTWSAVGFGFSGPGVPPTQVLALETFDAGLGAGPELWAGGEFQSSGPTGVLRIARWNGSAWLPGSIVQGGANGTVRALEVYDRDGPGPFVPELYAGGSFTQMFGVPVSSIARWNGTTWASAGTGVGGIVECLLAHDPDGGGPQVPVLYAGGSPGPLGSVQRWNGTSWSPVGGLPYHVYDLRFFDDGQGAGPVLYAACPRGLLRFDGTVWSFAGAPFAAEVRALTVYDRDGTGPQPPLLYLGGAFTSSSPSTGQTLRIATWNGTLFGAVGQGFDGTVERLAVVTEGGIQVLVAGGAFQAAGSTLARRIAKWAGSAWAALGPGMTHLPGSTASVRTVHAYDPDGAGAAPAKLHAGGSFVQAGLTGASHVARVEPPTWGCPCGNWGLPTNGCSNSQNPLGARLQASGIPSLSFDTVVLESSGETLTASSVVTQGTSPVVPVVFGDGLRCVGGSLKRLYLENAVGGTVVAPQPGDPSISQRSADLGDPIPIGSTRFYYVYYRDPQAFCTAATFNTSSAFAISWVP